MERLLEGDPVALARVTRLINGFLARWNAYHFRDEWDDLMLGSDVCYAPVLDMDEAPRHPHNVAREAFVEVEGVMQPAPAPRFSATPGEVQMPPPAPGQHTDEILAGWGFEADDIAKLRDVGAVS